MFIFGFIQALKFCLNFLFVAPCILCPYSNYTPLAPSIHYTLHLTKIFILKCEGIIEKILISAESMSR